MEDGNVKALLYALLSLSLIVGSVWNVIAAESLYHRAEKATGTVVEVKLRTNPEGSDSRWFIVDFLDSKGVVYRAKGWSGVSATLRKGDSIELLYDPKDPSNIRHPRRFAPWGTAAGYFTIGVLFILKAIGCCSTIIDNNLREKNN